MMKAILMTAAALALAGCSAEGGFAGSPHAMGGVIDTPFGGVLGVPNAMSSGDQMLSSTIDPDGTREDMRSAYIIKPDGTIIVTGPYVEYMALARLCLIAPNADVCGGGGEGEP